MNPNRAEPARPWLHIALDSRWTRETAPRGVYAYERDGLRVVVRPSGRVQMWRSAGGLALADLSPEVPDVTVLLVILGIAETCPI